MDEVEKMAMNIQKIDERNYERIFVMTDLHGRYDLFKKIADEIDFTKKDLLIIMGDSCDRGEYAYELYNWYITKQNEGYSIIHLLGNHEDMLLKSRTDERYRQNWMYNGGNNTIQSFFRNQDEIENIEEYYERNEFYKTDWIFKFIEDMPNIAESENYLFVHAGIDFSKKLSEQDTEYTVWTRDDWQLNNNTGKIVYYGHTPQLRISVINNCINLDRGAFYTDILSCAELKENKIYTVRNGEVGKEKFEILDKNEKEEDGTGNKIIEYLKKILKI